MTAAEIQEILAEVVARRGAPPQRIRSDNGPEFAAEAVRSYLKASGSGTLYVAPASPWQNGFAESFHSKLRDEFLERRSSRACRRPGRWPRSGRRSTIRNVRTVR